MKWLLLMVCILIWMTSSALAGTPSQPSKEAASPAGTVEDLESEIRTVLATRDQAMLDLRDRYLTAPLAERTALETEGAALAREYDRAYLTLLVEYHRLTGNSVERERAERMLAGMDVSRTLPVGSSIPDDGPRNLPDPPAPALPAGPEGGQPHAQ